MAPLARVRERAERAATHYAVYHRPLHHALTQMLGDTPRSLTISPYRDACSFGVPLHYNPGDKEREAVERAVCERLGLVEPVVTWQLAGRKPEVLFTKRDLLPTMVRWPDIAALVESATADQLLCGLGAKSAAVSVSTKLDSPHFGIAMGTGGGKSNTASFWLVQELRRGAIALILDAKYMSHPWCFKDMDANYDQLPNVAYARTTEALHYAMVWLGVELQRRTEEAERLVNAKGDILGDVGPRIWIVAEELNLAVPRLKQFWSAIRDPDTDPKRSPALDGMAAVSFAGRAVKMHLIVIGQMLTAATLGGGDVRENIGVRMMSRYTANSWKMQTDLPMPAPSDIPGRVQIIASGTVREAQVPLMDFEQVRKDAVSGIVAACPADMPGIASSSYVPLPTPPRGGSDLPFVLGHPPGRPPGTLTLREATAEGMFRNLGAARKRVQRYAIEPAGRDGSSNLYYIADLAKTLRSVS